MEKQSEKPWLNKGGRNRKAEALDELKQKIENYFITLGEEDRLPTIIGFKEFINFSETTLNEWKKIWPAGYSLQHKAKEKIKRILLEKMLKEKPEKIQWYLGILDPYYRDPTKISVNGSGNSNIEVKVLLKEENEKNNIAK